MDSDGKKNITYIQCQTCGEIYKIPRIVAIDNLYVEENCPNCGIMTGLNLGSKKEDIYYFLNENFDYRYY